MVDIIRLHGDPHKQTQHLLPWYVNGTLDENELAAVEAHLADCAECRAELAAERAFGREMARLPADADQGWAKLRDRIEGAAPRRRSAMRLEPRAFLRRPVAIGWAMAAQAASLLLIVGLVWFSTQQPRPLYRTLGSAPTAAVGNVVVIFRPTTPESALRGALVDSGARLVDGPTASGAYVVRVVTARRAAALATLRSDRHVMLAEPIDGDAQP